MNDEILKQIDDFIKKVYKNEEKFSRWLNSRHSDLVCYCSAVAATRDILDALTDLSSINDIQIDETLQNRIKQINYSDKFQPFLLHLMNIKHLDTVDVYKNALMDRKTFSKIKSDEDYHPKKLTALCLCIGLELNIHEAKDFLNRAGYSFSAADLTDIIFSFFIESGNYDIYAIDEILLHYNLPTITKFE